MSCRAVLTVAAVPLGVAELRGVAEPQELPRPLGVFWGVLLGVPLGVGPLDPPLPFSGLHVRTHRQCVN